jgi:hypothetical protein
VPGAAEYLAFLATTGYPLSTIEQVVVGERRRGVRGVGTRNVTLAWIRRALHRSGGSVPYIFAEADHKCVRRISALCQAPARDRVVIT